MQHLASGLGSQSGQRHAATPTAGGDARAAVTVDGTRSVIGTVLFCDLVGSTELAA